MIKQKEIDGKVYLRISDLSRMSGVEIRTLQRWVQAGELANFVTCYLTQSGFSYFRLGRPNPDDQLVPNSDFKYKLLDKDGNWL